MEWLLFCDDHGFCFCYSNISIYCGSFPLEYLQTLAFILTFAALVQFCGNGYKEEFSSPYKSLGVIYHSLLLTCAVLGVAILNIKLLLADGSRFSFIWAVLNGLFSGIGFTFVLLVMAGIRERLVMVRIAKK
jgi:electron transport complex protein RnfA